MQMRVVDVWFTLVVLTMAYTAAFDSGVTLIETGFLKREMKDKPASVNDIHPTFVTSDGC